MLYECYTNVLLIMLYQLFDVSQLFVFVRSELPHPSGRSPLRALGPALAPWPRGISAKVQSLWDLLESQVDALVLKKQDTRAAFWRWFLADRS
jgi:hypothetical protein